MPPTLRSGHAALTSPRSRVENGAPGPRDRHAVRWEVLDPARSRSSQRQNAQRCLLRFRHSRPSATRIRASSACPTLPSANPKKRCLPCSRTRAKRVGSAMAAATRARRGSNTGSTGSAVGGISPVLRRQSRAYKNRAYRSRPCAHRLKGGCLLALVQAIVARNFCCAQAVLTENAVAAGALSGAQERLRNYLREPLGRFTVPKLPEPLPTVPVV